MSEQKCTYASALTKNKIAKLEAERDAALAVIEKMREALKVAEDYAPSGIQKICAKALALQPDTSALRKRDAGLLRKAAERLESNEYIKRQPPIPYAEAHELRQMAGCIEKGEPL